MVWLRLKSKERAVDELEAFAGSKGAEVFMAKMGIC